MTKFLLSFITIILLINLISAAKLGASPASVEFNGSINEKICQRIILFSSNETIIGDDKWSFNKEFVKDIKEYNTNAEDLDIKIDYSKEMFVENRKEIEVCLTAKKSGNYYGILSFRTENKPAGVGIWVIVDIDNNGSIKLGSFKITGSAIDDKIINQDMVKMALGFNTFFLFIDFLVLIIMKRKMR